MGCQVYFAAHFYYMTEAFERLRRWENGHIALWLLKDTCWLLSLKAMAMTMAAPTIFLAVWLTLQARKRKADLAHNIAVCFWIGGNIVWMIGEFFYHDNWRPYAKWFFFLGLATVAIYYGSLAGKRLLSYYSLR